MIEAKSTFMPLFVTKNLNLTIASLTKVYLLHMILRYLKLFLTMSAIIKLTILTMLYFQYLFILHANFTIFMTLIVKLIIFKYLIRVTFFTIHSVDLHTLTLVLITCFMFILIKYFIAHNTILFYSVAQVWHYLVAIRLKYAIMYLFFPVIHFLIR